MNFGISTEYIIIFVNLFLFVVAPFLPNVVYNSFVETYVGASVLLFIVMYSATYGYLPAVASFTGVASLYAESHARKATKVKTVIKAPSPSPSPSSLATKVEKPVAPTLVPNEEHPDIHTPEDDTAEKTVSFTGKEDDGYNAFEPVDASINQKDVLPTISLSKDAEQIYETTHLAEKME